MVDGRLLVDVVAGGVAAGAVYALMALGLVLIYKTAEIVNFGHGDMATVCTFLAYALAVQTGLPLVPSVLLSLLCAALLGTLVEWGILRVARARHATVLSLVVATLGLALVLNGVVGIVWGHDVKTFPFLWTGPPLQVGTALVPKDQVLNLAVGVALAGMLYGFFRYTVTGIAMRATIANLTAAHLVGIPVNRMFALSWAIGSVLGALAGILAAPVLYLEPNRMVDLLLKGFAAAVLGGMDSLPGAPVGGVVLGVLENLAGAYGSLELKASLAFLLIVVALTLRPQGLLGTYRGKRA